MHLLIYILCALFVVCCIVYFIVCCLWVIYYNILYLYIIIWNENMSQKVQQKYIIFSCHDFSKRSERIIELRRFMWTTITQQPHHCLIYIIICKLNNIILIICYILCSCIHYNFYNLLFIFIIYYYINVYVFIILYFDIYYL